MSKEWKKETRHHLKETQWSWMNPNRHQIEVGLMPMVKFAGRTPRHRIEMEKKTMGLVMDIKLVTLVVVPPVVASSSSNCVVKRRWWTVWQSAAAVSHVVRPG